MLLLAFCLVLGYYALPTTATAATADETDSGEGGGWDSYLGEQEEESDSDKKEDGKKVDKKKGKKSKSEEEEDEEEEEGEDKEKKDEKGAETTAEGGKTEPEAVPPTSLQKELAEDVKSDGQQPAAAEKKADIEVEKKAEPALEVVAGSEAMPDQSKDKRPYSLSFSLGNSMGMGVFAPNVNTGTFVTSLGVNGSYRLQKNISVGMGFSVYKSLINSYVTHTTYPKELEYSDVSLSASWGKFYQDSWSGVSFSGNAGLKLPISIESRHQGLLFALSAGVNAIRKFWEINCSYAFSFKKNFHRWTAAQVPNQYYIPPSPILEWNDPELVLNRFQPQRYNNSSFSFSNRFSASYGFMEKFSFSISFGLAHAFKYSKPIDEFSVEDADSVGRTDIMMGGLNLNYAAYDNVSLSFGASTAQAPYYRDNTGIRFPFFDFVSTADNLTSLYLNLTYTY